MCSLRYAIVGVGCAALMSMSLVSSATYSIPADKLDPNKVFFGASTSFSKPGEVDYEDVVKATPEYQEVKDAKVETGTGKYWILMSQASDRAVKAISQVGQDGEYDLIAAQGYLGKLEPAIPADDITKLVVGKLDDSREQKSKGQKVETKQANSKRARSSK